MTPTSKLLKKLNDELVDRGLIIEAGWQGFNLVIMNSGDRVPQKGDLRNAFFAGARHLFDAVMTMLDPGQEPTSKDLERMDSISSELDYFLEEFKKRYGCSSSSAEAKPCAHRSTDYDRKVDAIVCSDCGAVLS